MAVQGQEASTVTIGSLQSHYPAFSPNAACTGEAGSPNPSALNPLAQGSSAIWRPAPFLEAIITAEWQPCRSLRAHGMFAPQASNMSTVCILAQQGSEKPHLLPSMRHSKEYCDIEFSLFGGYRRVGLARRLVKWWGGHQADIHIVSPPCFRTFAAVFSISRISSVEKSSMCRKW